MDQPVSCCHRHRFIHEDAALRAERMIAGNNQTAALIAMCYQLEQHTRSRVVAFDIPEVIYHYHPLSSVEPTLTTIKFNSDAGFAENFILHNALRLLFVFIFRASNRDNVSFPDFLVDIKQTLIAEFFIQ